MKPGVGGYPTDMADEQAPRGRMNWRTSVVLAALAAVVVLAAALWLLPFKFL